METDTEAPEVAAIEVTETAPELEEAPKVAPAPDMTAIHMANARLAQEAAQAAAQADSYKRELEALRQAQQAPKAPTKRSHAQWMAEMQAEGLTLEDFTKTSLHTSSADIARAASQREIEAMREEMRKEMSSFKQSHWEAQHLSKIEGQLQAGDSYEQARAAGWDAQRVYQRQNAEYQRTGKDPGVKATLDAIETEELERLAKLTSTAKAKAKLAPPAPKVAPVVDPPAKKGPNTVSSIQNGTPKLIVRKQTQVEKDREMIAKYGGLFGKK